MANSARLFRIRRCSGLKANPSRNEPVRRENDSGDVPLSAGQGLPQRARLCRQGRGSRLRSGRVEGDNLPVVVICELKLTFNLELWLAARLSSRGRGRESDARFRNLCRMLGFGLLGVLPNGQVEVLMSPTAPMPRKKYPPPIPSRRGAPPLARRSRRRRGIADADHDNISPARSHLRRRVGGRTATPAGPQSVDPRRLQYPLSKRLWLVRRRRARSLRADPDGSEGASALAADDFASRFAVPSNRRIEADHCLKINPEWTCKANRRAADFVVTMAP
jgi:hypothetical protein